MKGMKVTKSLVESFASFLEIGDGDPETLDGYWKAYRILRDIPEFSELWKEAEIEYEFRKQDNLRDVSRDSDYFESSIWEEHEEEEEDKKYFFQDILAMTLGIYMDKTECGDEEDRFKALMPKIRFYFALSPEEEIRFKTIYHRSYEWADSANYDLKKKLTIQ